MRKRLTQEERRIKRFMRAKRRGWRPSRTDLERFEERMKVKDKALKKLDRERDERIAASGPVKHLTPEEVERLQRDRASS